MDSYTQVDQEHVPVSHHGNGGDHGHGISFEDAIESDPRQPLVKGEDRRQYGCALYWSQD